MTHTPTQRRRARPGPDGSPGPPPAPRRPRPEGRARRAAPLEPSPPQRCADPCGTRHNTAPAAALPRPVARAAPDSGALMERTPPGEDWTEPLRSQGCTHYRHLGVPAALFGGRRNRPANFPHMRLWLAAFVVLLLGACAPSAPVGLAEVHDERGFTVRYPQRWTQVRRDDAVWFVPAGADRIPDVAEFIVVVTRASAGRLDDPAIRRTVFELLPVQGVSGFQRDARTSTESLWYKFEVTGASGGQEWASVGVLVSGATRYHVVVCAKPLGKWRRGQEKGDAGGRRVPTGDTNH